MYRTQRILRHKTTAAMVCSVCAAIWQKIEKYPLPYLQTTEHLLSTGSETPQIILRSPPFLWLCGIELPWFLF